jgi:O-antigen/teichoic acid export membrane protein
MAGSIAVRSVHSGVWLLLRRFAANAIRLAAVAVLARHLSAAEFGVVALAEVVLQFIVLTSETGVGTYVIYDRSSRAEERTHSAFWLGVVVTVAQMLVFIVVAPLVARYYAQPVLFSVLLFLAAAFAVRQLSVVPDALTRKRLDYRPLVVRDTACDVLSASLSVALALGGYGVWSLVLPSVLIEPVRLVAVFSIARWRPRLRFGTGDWPTIGRYSFHVMGTNLLNLVANDGDTLLVGKVLGSRALGFYDLAWQLSNVVSKNITAVVGTVAMPALAMLDRDYERLRAAYCRMLRLLAVVSFPILVGMFVLAGDLVSLIYGPGWEPVILLLRVFILFTLVRSVTALSGVIFLVTGRPEIGTRFNLAFTPVYLAAIWLGSARGLVGVASAVALVRAAGACVSLVLSNRSVQLRDSRALLTMAPAALLALGMGAAVWVMREALVALHAALLPRIVVCVLAGALVYGGALALFARDAYLEVVGLASSMVPSLRARAATPGGRHLAGATDA